MALNLDKKFKPRKVPEIECNAYHEAGHVFVYSYYNIPFKYVTLIPKGDTIGVVSGDLRPKLTELHFDYKSKIYKVIQRLTIAYAGILSEALYSGLYNEDGLQSDFQKFGDLLVRLIPEDQERYAFFEWIELRTFNLLSFKLNWLKIEFIAKSLLVSKKLKRTEIFNILDECKDYMIKNIITIDDLKSPPGLR